MWPDRRWLDLVGTELPIIQAPMAGAQGSAMASAVCQAGGLGSLPCAMLDVDKARAEIGVIKQRAAGPLNVNFFCHTPAEPNPAADRRWRQALRPFYIEKGLDPDAEAPAVNRAPFDEAMCDLVEETKPEVISFHFGLPAAALLDRVKATGAVVMSSATSVAEARWLEQHGVDAVIAQGYEAGGHRGVFLSDDISSQAGTMALVPQIVDALAAPVIAAGGIADGRGIAAAMALGAAAVQIGTAYLFTPEAKISDLHRRALADASDDGTALTNLFSGRPARGLYNRVMRELGPISDKAPPFPTAGGALAPLKAAAEAEGRADFSSLWSGQAAGLGRDMGAAELTRTLADEALARLRALGGS
ncbi:MAG: nitronate monooxygenase [Alphaproteobacteria bacterium]|nr:nitronate monooxygenase [Alphaproteobacteria bacterium]